MNLDIDVSNKIGEKVKINNLLKNLTRTQLANVYRKLYQKANPGRTVKIGQGSSEAYLMEKIKKMEPTEQDIPKTKAKGDAKHKVIIQGWELSPSDPDDPDFLESEGWTYENSYPSGLDEYSKVMTKRDGFKMRDLLKDMMGENWRMYYETKIQRTGQIKQNFYHNGI